MNHPDRRWFIVCCVLVLLPAGCTAGTAEAPAPGLPPPVPVTIEDARFGASFFSPKLNSADLPCADLQTMGIRTTFFGAWWGQIEPEPGQYDWSTIDPPVDAALACGVEPVVKITGSPGPGQAGTPPDDEEAYARFVTALAGHLKGRVSSYAIENEVNNPRMTWTADSYGRLRAVAYQAVKGADPQARVLDGGLTMQAYLAARASELARAGDADGAVAMLQRFQAGMTRKPKNLPATPEELTRWLDQPVNVRGVALVDELRRNPGTYDAVQLHYLQDAWQLIPEYVSWVRAWFPGKAYEFWEIGYGWPGEEADQPFTEEGHAAGVIKTLVIALGEGGSRVIYEPYWDAAGPEDQPSGIQGKIGRGLMMAAGPRLAATAFGTMTGRLSDCRRAERLDLGAGIWAYRFTTPQGDVYAVWGDRQATVRLPVSASQATVTDLTGAATQADPAALAVGDRPVFVSIPSGTP